MKKKENKSYIRDNRKMDASSSEFIQKGLKIERVLLADEMDGNNATGIVAS